MELTRQSDRLFSVRIPQENLKDHSRKQDIETGMRMNEQGDLYRVSFFSYSLKPPITFVLCRKDSFAQSIYWPMLSRTKNHQYLVTMNHIEVFYTPLPFQNIYNLFAILDVSMSFINLSKVCQHVTMLNFSFFRQELAELRSGVEWQVLPVDVPGICNLSQSFTNT